MVWCVKRTAKESRERDGRMAKSEPSMELNVEQVRNFRLHAHHLDTFYAKADVLAAVGACGMQNTPPGAWEAALFNRVPACKAADRDRLLLEERSLVQAWSFRGTPVVFPAADSAAFLSALAAEGEEPWIYTRGIGLALDFLGVGFGELLVLLEQVMPQLDGRTVTGKTSLDQTLAAWMEPLLPAQKRSLWNELSMYGSPDKQTVGGAAVSFLLRPCSFKGLVVFGAREGASPTFTSYRTWLGRLLAPDADASRKLVRKFVHCYGPTTADRLAAWLGCSGAQARRLWKTAADEMEPVTFLGKKAYVLSADRERLLAPQPLERELLLLAAHDPYLDQRDRVVLQSDKALQRRIWRTVANPGAIVHCGEVVGTWTGTKKGAGLEVEANWWSDAVDGRQVRALAEQHAAFRGLELTAFEG